MSILKTTEENREALQQRRTAIQTLILNAKEFYLQQDDAPKVEVFDSLLQNLVDGEFTIVVVGEFSAGKSTLLNAMMGQRILPSFTSETTATVNFLHHKERSTTGAEGIVYYKDGTETEIPKISYEEVEKYSTTVGENVVDLVKQMDLYLESEFLKDGVTLVDSPGLNGVERGHRQVTEQQIMKSHASLFVFSADHPGTKTDFEFIQYLQTKVDTILFVLNKKDHINLEEQSLETVIQTLKKNYKLQFPELTQIPEIWPISAKNALNARRNLEQKEQSWQEDEEEEAGLEKFEQRLMNFLTNGEKTQQEFLAPVGKVLSILKESKQTELQHLEALSGKIDLADVEVKISELESSLEALKQRGDTDKIKIKREIQRISREIREGFQGEMERYRQKKQYNLKAQEDSEDGLREEVAQFKSNFRRQLLRELDSVQERFYEEVNQLIFSQYESLALKVEEEFSQVETFSVTLLEDNTAQEPQFDLHIGIDKLNEKVEEKQKILRELEAEQEACEDQMVQARRKERERKKLENELESLKAEQRNINEMYIPAEERYQDTEHIKVNREGIFGFVGNIFLGKRDSVRQVWKVDDSAKKAMLEKQETQRQDVTQQVKDVHNKLGQMGDDVEDISILQHSRMEKKLEEASKELMSVIEEKNSTIDSRHKTQMKKMLQTMNDYCDEVADEYASQVKTQLTAMENSHVTLILRTIEASVEQSILKQKTELDKLLNTMQQSEADKTSQEAKHQENIGIMDELIGQAMDLYTELEEMQVDKIVYSDLLSEEV